MKRGLVLLVLISLLGTCAQSRGQEIESIHNDAFIDWTTDDLAWVLYQQGRAKEALPLANWALQARESRHPADKGQTRHK